MEEWWSYGLSDFLLFSPRAYWRLFELHNAALWPLPVMVPAAGLVVLAQAILRPRGHARWIALSLSALWAWVAWSFLWQHYATINWAALYVAPVFALEATLLAVGSWHCGLTLDRRGAVGVIGILLLVVAIGFYPLLAPISGRSWSAAEVFGIAPDPTAIGTLGFLLLARGKWLLALLPVPLLWCAASGATLWALDASEAWIPAMAAMVTLLTLTLSGWSRRETA